MKMVHLVVVIMIVNNILHFSYAIKSEWLFHRVYTGSCFIFLRTEMFVYVYYIFSTVSSWTTCSVLVTPRFPDIHDSTFLLRSS